MLKKNTSASTLGRRNPQQILKDFVYPEPANVVSASPTLQGGYGGGQIPGCAGGGDPPAGADVGCVDDYFDRTTSAGSGFGTADSGQDWDFIFGTGNGTTNVTVPGNGRLLAVGSGSGTFLTSANQIMSPTCAADGVDAEILAHFRIGGTGWESTIAWSLGDSSVPGSVYAPGNDLAGGLSGGTPEAGVAHHYVQVQTSGSAFGTYMRIFNADGQLWVATKHANSIYQNMPTAIGPAATEFWVRMWVTSPGNLYGKVWTGELDEQPAGWIVDEPFRDWSGDQIVSAVFRTNVAAYTAYSVALTEYHVNTTLTTNRSGLFSGELFRENNYWRPKTNLVDYFISVFFDGIKMVQGVDYTVQDGYKVVPTNYELLNNTVVQSEFVVK